MNGYPLRMNNLDDLLTIPSSEWRVTTSNIAPVLCCRFISDNNFSHFLPSFLPNFWLKFDYTNCQLFTTHLLQKNWWSLSGGHWIWGIESGDPRYLQILLKRPCKCSGTSTYFVHIHRYMHILVKVSNMYAL